MTQIRLWQNPVPSSPIYCRPVRIEFVKENDQVVRKEFDRLDDEIENIVPTLVEGVTVHQKFYPTMVDGKVVQILSGTASSGTCYLCDPTPVGMNDIEEVYKMQPSEELLRYGESPMHLYLNTRNCVLLLAYRLEI